MTTSSIDQLLLEGVRELYDTEQQHVGTLRTMADETGVQAASRLFRDHSEETTRHVERLERVFDELGAEPRASEDTAVTAIIDDREQFSREHSGEALDRNNMAVGQTVEHYEIASYGNLASLAEKTGNDAAAALLVETLREEQATLEALTEVSERFDQQQVAGG